MPPIMASFSSFARDSSARPSYSSAMGVDKRIKEGRQRLGLNEEQFGKLVGVSRGSVQQWEKGTTAPNRKRQPVVASALGLTVAELMSDEENVAVVQKQFGVVPLISWVKAGDWMEAADPLQPGEAEKWLPCPVNHSERSFALRVRGDSMTAPHGRTYPEGCIVFVDPERRLPINGERIIAKLAGSNEVTFKVFKEEDGRRWLQPLNPSHLPIREAFRVLGTVIGKWEDE
jgi:SOS-response transcriptional repressor LexA